VASFLQWGILGTGGIAHAFADGLVHSKTSRLTAAGSRSRETAAKFGQQYGLPPEACHASYEALLADPNVHAIYISNPHPGHAEWAIHCAEAGKHILCEKPLAMNHAEAMAVVEAARRQDVFLMEAFMYRCHPQTLRIAELIREGAIGQVRVIQATFSFHAAADPGSRLLDPALGGGGILDVGCYPVSMARFIAGVAGGQPFAEPEDLYAVGHLGATGVDAYTAAVARFPGDIVAQLATGVQVAQDNTLRIYGDAGYLVVPTPWAPGRDGGSSRLLLHRKGTPEPREILVETPPDLLAYIYTIEADHVAAHLAERQSPAMNWADSLGNMRTLDRWREAIGLVYPLETAGHPDAVTTVAGRTLSRRPDQHMKFGRIDGLDKTVSRLVLGCDNQRTYAQAAAMFDGFFEEGGNCFDTAYVYGNGLQESLLGQWIRNRAGIRDEIVVIGKGAHTPHCHPAGLTAQLLESLERMQTDYVDVYLLHRDDPAVPVGEFIEVLNEHWKAGRMRAFGGSNWSIQRVEEANAYAARHGLRPFAVVSNNLSLARMVQPVWGGCVTASDPESLAWFTRHQMPLLCWSSQARGFFVAGAPAKAGVDGPTADEIARFWHSEDNFWRRERAIILAKEKGVTAMNVALAYVLSQSFPTFALFGPRTLAEIRTSFPGLGLELSPGELAWLNLEGDR
jgi:predicted dehydrogenase/aryl-alcohol dehydrogenase-like predicted oxidoreductase